MSKDPSQMSRRDWFRLRTLANNPASTPRLGGEQKDHLQPAPEPVNHGGVDLASLPPMHQATLDVSEVASLFSDIKQHATAVHFIIARCATGSELDQSEQLRLVSDQLLSGKIKKVQVRYRWENANWIDTLERSASEFRLVRIQHA